MGIQMKNIARFYKNYCEWINYAILLVAVIFSCLNYYAAFAVIGLIVIFSCFYSTEHIITLVFVMYTIKMAILPGLFDYVLFFVLLMLIKNLIIDCLKNKHKLSLKVFVCVFVLLIYGIVSHVFTKYKEDTFLFEFVIDVLILYIAYEYRDKINIFKIIKVFAVALILSGIISLIIGADARFGLYELLSRSGYVKNYGITENANIYGMGMIIAISALLVGFYFDKYSMPVMLSYFIPCFILGFLTISRNFIVSVGVALCVFGLCYLKKHRAKSLKLLLSMCVIVCAIMLIFEQQTLIYFKRGLVNHEVTALTKFEGLMPEDYELIFAGLIKSNPGRLGIWKNYFKCVFRSPFYVFFGVGVAAVRVGQTHAHNGYIYWFYRFGLVGLAILGCLLFLMLKKSKVLTKQNKSLIPFIFVFVLPICIMMLFDICYIINSAVIFIVLALNELKTLKNEKQSLSDNQKMEEMLLKKPSKF